VNGGLAEIRQEISFELTTRNGRGTQGQTFHMSRRITDA
jgi:hypothetical protein